MFLILIFIFNLVIGVVFLIYSGKITSTVINRLQAFYLLNYYDDNEIKSLFDLLQGQYSCCGIQGYKGILENFPTKKFFKKENN